MKRKLSRQDKIILNIFGVSLLIIIGFLVFLNLPKSESNIDFSKGEKTQPTSENAKIHVPLNLSKDDVLVSFRIDDITFEKKQKPVLENALILARKYNITFDLAVIAQPFDKNMDNATFKIYQDNQDVFEVVAHGLTHKNPVNSSNKGEFYDTTNKKPILLEIQEEYIKAMKSIFEKHNLTMATKIFILPWSAGDNNTIYLAEKHGYKLMTQTLIPKNSLSSYKYSNENIIVSSSWVSVDMNETLVNKEISKYLKRFDELISKSQKNIQIITHPINFYKIENSENLIKKFTSLNNSKIKFSFISKRFRR